MACNLKIVLIIGIFYHFLYIRDPHAEDLGQNLLGSLELQNLSVSIARIELPRSAYSAK